MSQSYCISEKGLGDDLAPYLVSGVGSIDSEEAQSEVDETKAILKGSIAFTRKIDEAAAAMYALQHEVLPAQGIPVQGVGREAYRS